MSVLDLNLCKGWQKGGIRRTTSLPVRKNTIFA
jgi:hypothetical protein